MVWIIPNTFIAGTKAKANEVNENFTSAKQFMDNLETEQATNTADILQLEQNKADLNGSVDQVFKVDDAVNGKDAVNKNVLTNLTNNSKFIIMGFELNKFNDNTISANPGSCYDSTFEYMIISSETLSIQQENLGNLATYYVYVCTDKDTKSNQLVISLSDTTPELPSGFEYYRRLGSFTTDDTGIIDKTYSDSNEVTLGDLVKLQDPSYAMPDYDKSVARSLNTDYDEDTAGFVAAYSNSSNNANIIVYANEYQAYSVSQWKYVQSQKILVPIPKGYTWRAEGSNCSVEWIPCVGA